MSCPRATAYRFISCVSFVALLFGVNCTKRSTNPAIANQKDAACARQVDIRLIAAALKDNADDMEAAVKSGANVDAIIENLGPSIVIATLTGNYRGVKMLLNNGANVNAVDSERYTPILNAALSDRRDIAKLLLSNGADVNTVANVKVKGNGTAKLTPLMIAKTRGYQEMAQMLIAAGAKE